MKAPLAASMFPLAAPASPNDAARSAPPASARHAALALPQTARTVHHSLTRALLAMSAAQVVRKVSRRARRSDDASLSEDLIVKPSGQKRKKTGVLLLNIGTPASTSVDDVRDYLSRFLSDDRVIELEPWWLKAMLLQLLLATRPKDSAKNYEKIWDPVRGSPLLYHSQDVVAALQQELGSDYVVRLGFAYSHPFVGDSFKRLAAEGVDDVALVPMFPHYASSTTGSILGNVYKTAAELFCTPFIKVVPPFYSHPAYLACVRKTLEEALTPDVEHVIFSFHGLPESQCSRTDETQSVCLKIPNCCAKMRVENRNCYRAQCYETARVLAKDLGLQRDKWSVAFQSRLTLRGRIQWIRPYTDEIIQDLAKRGVKKLALVAPSFTADCVETLEELGISGREEFEAAGGEELVLVPCLNSRPDWIEGLAQIVLEQVEGSMCFGTTVRQLPAQMEQSTQTNGKAMWKVQEPQL